MPKTATTSDRNATPSWSGYLYQGKVGILVALSRIVEIHALAGENTSTELNTWELVFEDCEDFDIKHDSKIVSRHQIKALMHARAHVKSSYTAALNAFIIKDCPRDGRFLHTVKEITDWDSSSVKSQKEIQRYIYPNGNTYCGLGADEIQVQALDYIKTLRPDDSDAVLVDIYRYLLYLLIEEVNKCHNGETGSKAPIMRLSSMFEAIVDCPIDSIYKDLQIIRLKTLLVKGLHELEEDIVSANNDFGPSWSVVEEMVEDVCQQNDDQIMQFLNDIHPEKRDFGRDYDFNSAGFKYVFLELLRKTEQTYISEQRGYYFDKRSYLVSTNIDDEGSKIINARRVLLNPNNTRVMFEGKNIVTKNIDYSFSDLTGDEHAESILDPQNIKFVKVDDALASLGVKD